MKGLFSKNQAQPLPVLRDISLSIDTGDVVALIGPSGSGKTTLLRCLNFLEYADSGLMEFMGEAYNLENISSDAVKRIRGRTGFVFQEYNLFANMTALENVTSGLVISRKVNKAEAAKLAMEALERVGLGDRASYYPIQLSGGQQ
ncbi:MAG: amino acid ABC transporter ATP-binding protein, partial [Clostridia bacterium]|nr:amino acid ABC transporter ATP-binding protein [Clostridia bacterium]